MNKNKEIRNELNIMQLSYDTEAKIVNIYNAKTRGSRAVYMCLAAIINTVTIVFISKYIFNVEATITMKDYATLFIVLAVILVIDAFIVLSECVIIHRNVNKHRMMCYKGKIDGKKELNTGTSENQYYKYEIYRNNEVFRLACSKEFKYIDENAEVNFVYVKSTFGKSYIPLMVYLPDEIGLDYETLSNTDFSYEQFRDSKLHGKPISMLPEDLKEINNSKSYHNDLDGKCTSSLIELEEKLANAPAGSKEQLRLMEKIGEERHKIKKLNARKNKLRKIKEIIAIIKR